MKRFPRAGRPVELPYKEWATVVSLQNQAKLITFLTWWLGTLFAATVIAVIVMFFLEGFRFRGFCVDPELLKWLAKATVGAIAGLFMFTFKAVFEKHQARRRVSAPQKDRPRSKSQRSSLVA